MTKAQDRALAATQRARATEDKAAAEFQRGDWGRKIEAAEAHLAWLRAMPVPTEAVTGDGVAD